MQVIKKVKKLLFYGKILIRHSENGNIRQYTNDALPEFMIHSGKSHEFITDSDNKYLNELLKSIDVDLYQIMKIKIIGRLRFHEHTGRYKNLPFFMIK